jgi:transcriptional regulator with AAA-type ATPase domain
MNGRQNPLISDFFTQRRGTVFCLFEARWRARDARSVQEIVTRFPPPRYDVRSVYAKARYRGTLDITELRARHLDFVKECAGTQQGLSSSQFLEYLERRNEGEGIALPVPDRGPVIITGRPESYSSFHRKDSEFFQLIDAAGYPHHRFRFASSDFLRSVTDYRDSLDRDNPDYRTIVDERTGSIYPHSQQSTDSGHDARFEEITDYALIYAARVQEFHTHGRLVTIVAGTGTLGTLGATKLLMDSDELLRRCPELLEEPIQWPIELLIVVKVKSSGESLEEMWDVSIKEVKVHLPVSVGYPSRRSAGTAVVPRSPATILGNLRDMRAAASGEAIDLTACWNPHGWPLAKRLIGHPRGVIADQLMLEIQKAARDVEPVLILGESGVGKEIAARLLFLYNALWRMSTAAGWRKTNKLASLRDDKIKKIEAKRPKIGKLQCPRWDEMRFVPMNCGAVEPNLIVAELFGSVPGGFTDAKDFRQGAFLEAGSGTLFLDEIHALTVHQQTALLRALGEQEVKPVGLDGPITFPCLVVAASNITDLDRLDSDRHFRGDLLNRFRRVLRIPPLNDRLEDALAYIAQTLHEREGGSSPAHNSTYTVTMTERFIRLVLSQDYRETNFRQLASLVASMARSPDQQLLSGDLLPEALRNQLPDPAGDGQPRFKFRAEFPTPQDQDISTFAELFIRPMSPDDSFLKPLSEQTAKDLSILFQTKFGEPGNLKCPWTKELVAWYLTILAEVQGWSENECIETLAARYFQDGHHGDSRRHAWGELFRMLEAHIGMAKTADLFGRPESRIREILRACRETKH